MGTEKTDMQDGPDPARALLDVAIKYHLAGRLADAAAGYREILAAQPDHGDATHMLGVLAYQDGRVDEAVALIRRAATLLPSNAGIHINLGNALQASGDPAAAATEFRRAIELAPGQAVAYNNLGNALRMLGKLDEAVDTFNKALSIDASNADAHVNKAIALQASNDIPAAIRSYETAVALDAGHESAAHMLAALRGEQTEAAPRAHVAQLFDDYAARFDNHLVETLGYSMPGMLRSEIERICGRDVKFKETIDLGCGTGLAGLEFRSLSERMTGVDLSPRMIDRARERNIYDYLLAGDIFDALESPECKYDLFVCADVFPYIGNVSRLFAAIAGCACDGALFAFSTEKCADRDFVLRPSGRYAHSQDYLGTVAAGYGFSVRVMRTENLRKQQEEWIPGDLVVLQYSG